MDGFIKVYRSLFENKLWSDKPFARGQAWIDLLQLANFADTETFIKGKCVVVKRGQILRGIDSLADRWGWSKNKVRAYLKLLENEKMVTSEGTPNGTLITIEKYEEYNPLGHESEHESGTSDGTPDGTPDRTPDRTRNKKEKKDKNNKSIDIYGEFQNVSLSDDEYQKLVERFPMDYQDRIERLSEYMASKHKTYKSHYATILSWARRDKEKKAEKDNASKSKSRLGWIDELIEEEKANAV